MCSVGVPPGSGLGNPVIGSQITKYQLCEQHHFGTEGGRRDLKVFFGMDNGFYLMQKNEGYFPYCIILN